MQLRLPPGSDPLDRRVTRCYCPRTDPCRRRTWFAVLAGTLVVTLIGSNLPSPLYPLYERRFHFGATILTVIFAAYIAGVLAALLCFGPASDHVGRRPVILAAVLLAGASTCLFLTAGNAATLLAARTVSGLATGLMLSATAAALAELEPAQNIRRAARVFAAASMIGLGLGPLIAGAFGQLAPAPTRLVYAAYLGLLGLAALAAGMLPETVTPRDLHIDVRPVLAVPAPLRAAFLPSGLGIFSAFTLLGVFAALISSFLRSTLHQSNLVLAGAVVLALFAVAAVAQRAGAGLASAHATALGLALQLAALGLLPFGASAVART